MRPQAFSTATSSSSATTVRGLEAPLRYGSPSVRASAMINLSLSLTLFFYLGGYQIIHFSDSSFFYAWMSSAHSRSMTFVQVKSRLLRVLGRRRPGEGSIRYIVHRAVRGSKSYCLLRSRRSTDTTCLMQ